MERRARRSTWMVVALAVVFVALLVWFLNRPLRVRLPVDEAVFVEATETRSPGVLDAPEPAPAREDVDAMKADPADAPPVAASPRPSKKPADPPIWIRGRVLDLGGVPVANQDIYQRGAPTKILTRSGPDGTFECNPDLKKGVLLATSAEYESFSGIPTYKPRKDPFIVVAPVFSLGGFVVDENGAALADAVVSQQFTEHIWSRFPLPLDATEPLRVTVNCVSQADGSFKLVRALRGDGIALEGELHGFNTAKVPQPSTATDDVRIVMTAFAGTQTPTATRRLTGTVEHPDGKPAVNAYVLLGYLKQKTRLDGSFEIDVPVTVSSAASLLACKADWQTATIENYGRIVRESTGALAPVRLVLGPPTLSIAGRVVDGDGKPLPECRVGLLDGTPIKVRSRSLTLETLNADPDGSRVEVGTGPNGEFEIFGLLPREYRFYALANRSFGSIESPPIQAGRRDVVLVIDTSAYRTNVAGRVVAVDGTPLEGVEVRVLVRNTHLTAGVQIGNRVGTVTDALGAFHFEHLPIVFTGVEVAGDAVIMKTFAPSDLDFARPLNLQVERRCSFQVVGLPLQGTTNWLSAKSVDDLLTPIGPPGGTSGPVVGAKEVRTSTTRVLYVGESTTELVLHREDGTRIETRAVRLVPGEVNVVKW